MTGLHGILRKGSLTFPASVRKLGRRRMNEMTPELDDLDEHLADRQIDAQQNAAQQAPVMVNILKHHVMFGCTNQKHCLRAKNLPYL